MKKLLLMFSFILLLVGCSNKEESTKMRTIKFEDQTIEVKEDIKKVVVFDMASLDTIDYLNLSDLVIGLPKKTIPSYLSKYEDKKYADTGEFAEPDFEKLSELAPDLIIISNRSIESLDKLKKIAPTLLLGTDNNDLLKSFKNNATILGELFNKEVEIKAALGQMDDTIKETKAKINPDLKTLVMLTTESKISVYGGKSRFGLIHDILGIPMTDENIEDSTHGQSVNYEYLAKVNPDVIYVLDRDFAIKAQDKVDSKVLDNTLVNSTTAAKNENINYLNGDAWYISGLSFQSFEIMINDLKPSYQK